MVAYLLSVTAVQQHVDQNAKISVSKRIIITGVYTVLHHWYATMSSLNLHKSGLTNEPQMAISRNGRTNVLKVFSGKDEDGREWIK